jgi:hypothetical protein
MMLNSFKLGSPGLRRTSSSRKKPLHLLQAALGQEAINRITRLLGFRLRGIGTVLRPASCPQLHINLAGILGRTCGAEKPCTPAGTVGPPLSF